MDFVKLLSKASKHLSPSELGELAYAIVAYSEGRKYEVSSDYIQYLLTPFIEAIERRKAAAEIHRASGSKGGRPKKNQAEKNQNGFEKTKMVSDTPKNQNGFFDNQNGFSPNLSINDLQIEENQNGFSRNQNGFDWDCKEKEEVTQEDREKGKKETDTYVSVKKEKKPPKIFQPPSVEEVAQYCAEKKYTEINAEYFVAHYNSIGWVVGKNKTPMKDWKQTLVTWHLNRTQENNNSNGYRHQANNIGRDLSDREREYKSSF